MRFFVFVLILFFGLSFVYGQDIKPIKSRGSEQNLTKAMAKFISIQPKRREEIKRSDDTIIIAYEKNEEWPAIFINEKLMDKVALKTLSPNVIDSFSVNKEKIEINGRLYNGQIYVITKKDYIPAFLSLNELRKKYTNVQGKTLFLIDNDIVKGDYGKLLIDENYVLKIVSDTLHVNNESITLNVISIFTKTKENLKDVNTLYIR